DDPDGSAHGDLVGGWTSWRTATYSERRSTLGAGTRCTASRAESRRRAARMRAARLRGPKAAPHDARASCPARRPGGRAASAGRQQAPFADGVAHVVEQRARGGGVAEGAGDDEAADERAERHRRLAAALVVVAVEQLLEQVEVALDLPAVCG